LSEAFGKRSRLLKRPEFERVYEIGRRVRGQYMMLFVMSGETGRRRLGVAATRKVGSAVERNRLKRRAREIFRRRLVGGWHDVVVVPRREMLDASFDALQQEYLFLLKRGMDMARGAQRRNDSNHPPHPSSL
jgi:ribonuclease P protein component